MRLRRLEQLAPFLVLALALVIAFWDVIGPSRGLFFRDHAFVFKPRWWAVRESLLAGELPALTRASPAGVPLEQMLNATYTPATLLLFLGPFDVVYDLFVIAHFLILGIGVYLLARELGASRAEGVLAAGVAMLSGPVLSLENLLVALQGLAYAPWVYLALVRLFRAPSLARAGWLAIATGFHAQGMMAELFVLDLCALGFVFFAVRPRVSLRLVACCAVAAVLALGIAAIELLPPLEVLSETRRGHGFSFLEATQWSFGWPQVVELFVPSFWAPPEAPFIFLPAAVNSEDNPVPYLTTLYFGTGSVFVLAALAFGRRRVALFLGLALTLLIALGASTPLYGLVARVFASTRYPVKFLILTTAFAAVLAPLGLRTARPRALLLVALVPVLAAVSMLLVSRGPELGEALSKRPSRFVGVTPDRYPEIARALMTPRILHALFFALAILACAAALVVLERHRARIAWVAVLVVIADLAFAGRFAIFGASVDAKPDPRMLAALEDDAHRVYNVSPGGMFAEIPHHEGRTYFEERVESRLARGHLLYRGVRQYEQMDRDAAGNRASTIAFKATQHLRGREARRALARSGVSYATIWMKDDAPGARAFAIAGEPEEWLVPMEEPRPYVKAYTRWLEADPAAWSAVEFRRWFASEEMWNVALVDVEGATSTATIAGKRECEPANARTANAQTANAQTANAQTANAQTANAQTANAQTANAQTANPQTASAQTANPQTANAQTANAQTANARAASAEREQAPGDCACAMPKAALAPSSNAEHLAIDFESTCEAIVVVLETKMPGWHAFVDDRPAPILEAELGMMGIRVPPGRHALRFEYTSFARPLAPISLAALVFSILLTLGSRRFRA